ncbi:MAG: restriction endonuclease subunit S [Bacteroidetes bacterium]|nr:restriction endonuclease subunit S [Bacteroidota bacterium]
MSWRKVKLGSILKRRKQSIRIEPDHDYKLVTIKLYHKGVILRRIAKGGELGSTMSAIRAGDFILSGIDARNGAFGIVPNELDGAIVTNDFWCLDPDEKQIDKEFLLFLTSTDFFDYICKQSSDGTTQRIRLQKDRFFNYEITLPSIDDQKQILKKLKKCEFDSKAISSELCYQQDIVKQMRQAFLYEAMQGKLTKQNSSDGNAQELLDSIKADKTKSGKKEKPLISIKKEEIPFEIPENWVWCRLGELSIHSEAGKSFKCEETPIVAANEWGVIKVSAVSWDKFLEDQNKCYSKTKPEDVTAQIKLGDFLITRANTSELIGKSVVVKSISKNLLLSDKTIRFKFSDRVSTDFMNLCNNTKHARVYYAKSGTGSSPSMKNITREHMNNLLIPLPPRAEQERIVKKIDELMKYCDDLERTIIESQAQTAILLQQVLKEALSGEALPKQDLRPTIQIARKTSIDFQLTDEELRDLLGGYILTKADLQKDFGHLKLIKHMVTVEYGAETPMPTHYIQFPNGPYDKQFMEGIGYRLKKKEWFEEKKAGSGYTYEPLAKASEIEELFNHFFADKKEQIDFLISLMNKAKPSQAEIIATVYAVWNDLLINQMDASIDKIKLYFFKWSEKKKAFTPEQVEGCYKWMNEVGLVPKGTGRIIMRFA